MKNWPTKKLGELCEIKIGKTPRRGVVKYWTNGTLPWAKISEVGGTEITNTNEQITEIAARELNMTPFPRGTILYTFKLSIGRVGIAGVDLFTNEAIAGLLIKDKKSLMPKWLFYVLPLIDYRPFLSNAVKGNTLNKASLNLLPILFPPLKSQKQIVERMDKIAEAQKLNDELIEKSDELFQSLLHRELDSTGKDWEIKKLSELGNIITGTTPSTQNADYWNGKFLWATPTDIKENTFILTDTPKKLSREGYERTRPVPQNAILVTCIASIGKMALAGKEMATNQQINSIVCNEANDPFFVFFSLQKNKKKLIRLGKTAVVPIINKSEFGRMKIPTPSLKIQKQIVEKLSAAQEYKNQLLEQRLRLKELFDSVLHKSMKNV